jgi:hypothetical protein
MYVLYLLPLPPALPQSLVFPEIETVPAAISGSGVRGSTEGEGAKDGWPNGGEDGQPNGGRTAGLTGGKTAGLTGGGRPA